MLFTLKQPPLLSSLLPPEPARSIPNPDPPTPLAQVAEEAMARACSTAPILIHPEHLSPSLPIGERRMGGVRGRPISSQPGTSEPCSPRGDASKPLTSRLHFMHSHAGLWFSSSSHPHLHPLPAICLWEQGGKARIKASPRSGAGAFCWMLCGRSPCASLNEALWQPGSRRR